MQNKTNLIVLAGGGLLVANVLTDPTFDSLRTNVSAGTSTSADITSSPVKMVLVGLLTLVAASVIADSSDGAANVILIFILCLWLLWLMNYNKNKDTTGTASTTTKAKTSAKA